jgi:putative nucleotidyltransferase with HDIG domain
MIIQENVDTFKKWFTAYVHSFKTQNVDWEGNIALKEVHTLRVCQEILHIGRALGLSASDLRLAETIALFHDIGRFEQYARYQTFVDRKSVNHAELGVKILRENDVLGKLSEATRDLVLRAISYHNRVAVPADAAANPHCLFFSRLIRDADKLDIWRVVTDYYGRQDRKRNKALELELPDTPVISPRVAEDLLAGRIVDSRHLRSLNDFKLLQAGWVYDLNFLPTFQRLHQKAYLDIIKKVLPESAQVEQIFSAINAHLEAGCKKDQQQPRPVSDLNAGCG